MKKSEKITEYNNKNDYAITNTKRMTSEQVNWYKTWGKKSLYELYNNPSDYKINSYNYILEKYKPTDIIGVQGSCHAYSVLLQASNGDILHITKDNNYLIEVTQ